MAGASWGSNLLSGMGAGAAAGTAAMPGLGTAIGSGVGLIAGIFQSIFEDNNEERKQEALRQLAAKTNTSYDKIASMYNDFYQANKPGGTQKDVEAAANRIRNWDQTVLKRFEEAGLSSPEDYKFTYDKTVENFLNPFMGNVIDASNQKVQHSAAGAALGRSTGAAKAIAENTAREYNDIYNTALNAYNTDRAQSYNEWNGYLTNMNNRLNTLLNADQWSIEQQKALGDDFLNWQAQQVENKANLEKDRLNTNTQITLAGL